jgi:hypothetical protein
MTPFRSLSPHGCHHPLNITTRPFASQGKSLDAAFQEVLLDGSPPPLVNFFKEIAQHDSCHAWLSPLLVTLTGQGETGETLIETGQSFR